MQATNPLPLFPVGQSKRVIEEKNYDRSPDLSPEERKVLARIARRLKQGKQAGQLLSLPGLRRLMIPLFGDGLRLNGLSQLASPTRHASNVMGQTVPMFLARNSLPLPISLEDSLILACSRKTVFLVFGLLTTSLVRSF